ncbi:LLM class flavin-dependent oxidoreductase [Tomitella fengzijianii]|uniref:LLM class flavin-dependent oxidoreductase n=1 Tax=Tomitella fengzijianii TaxID=2597660 RepID=A0A516X380_9ACTN|nr:LLM class flavin-dependent oxidoreductase [Tomitella fengzijianii]QDQ97508.1 LLM class flavin-dependent oxidoreductase [Tomitella fengzijianii]
MRVALTLEMRRSPHREQSWTDLWEDCLWTFEQAERLGFDALLVQEHFFTSDGYGPSVPVFLSALASRTTTARIGSYIYIAPLHHPLALAQETAVLDQLSGGRLDVGLGIGHSVAEYRAYGMSPRTRPSRMEEVLDVLPRAWSGERFSYEGRYHHLENVQVQPTPAQQPHPPIWVAATTKPAAERAGRHGANLAAASVDPEVHEAYHEALATAGFAPGSTRVSNPWSITVTDEDPEAVWERNKHHYFHRWDYYRTIRSEFGDPDLDYGLAPSPDQYRANELIGDADAVLAALEPHVTGLGLTDLVLFGPHPGIDLRGEGFDALSRFADEVLPTLHKW